MDNIDNVLGSGRGSGCRSPSAKGVFPDLSLEGPSASHVFASRDRCESVYELDPHSRLVCNRYSQSEVGLRLEKVEEPLGRAHPLINQIRTVVKNANYCMLIADDECAAVAEYHDTDLARYLKKQGIAIGTLWDEASVGTNGIGTSTADTTAITVNGEQHYHSKFHQFICSAAPLIDQFGRRYGALNLTGSATTSATEVIRLSQFVRRAVSNLHSYVFRDYFQGHTLVAIADERFNNTDSLSKIFAIDDSGYIVGVTNDLMQSLEFNSREELMGVSLDKIIGLDFDTLVSSEERLHKLEHGKLGGRYAISVSPVKTSIGPSSANSTDSKTSNRTNTAYTRHNQAAREEAVLDLDALAGSDSRMIKNIQLCRRMTHKASAPNSIPLLLQGETGTGKDTFAKAVHIESSRNGKPFVELNCATIPESLIDSELFGYAPGTFTGGLKNGKAGYVEASNGGTLFLDEIGDMPLDSQTRLLRVLSERRVQPLGASQAFEVDFALICASNRDLLELVETGRFREDLYYRVCGAKITLPALRERSDFRTIVKSVLRRADPEGQITVSNELWHRLEAYSWPGNIRQLHNVIQYVVFSCDEGVATEHDLPDDILHERRQISSVTSVAGMPVADNQDLNIPIGTLSGTLARSYSGSSISKRDELLSALHKTRWCVAKAARVIGVSRATVHRQMKKFGIVRPDHQVQDVS